VREADAIVEEVAAGLASRGVALRDETRILYGINPLLEYLQADPRGILRLVIASGRRGASVEKVLSLASRAGTPVVFEDRAVLDRLAGPVVHQGVVGFCRPFRYASLDDAMSNRSSELEGSVILLVYGVTDPQNLGALIRSACCLGAEGVVIPAHRAAGVTPAVIKASAGAAHHIPVVAVANLVQTMEELKRRQYWIYGAHAGAGKDLEAISFEGNVALVVGSEGKGLRPLVRRQCDVLCSVPMVGKIDSLNVSVATGIMLYAVFKALRRGV
jgi:23S rRNA (guanosine2251-2'-O)-methyltransferase